MVVFRSENFYQCNPIHLVPVIFVSNTGNPKLNEQDTIIV